MNSSATTASVVSMRAATEAACPRLSVTRPESITPVLQRALAIKKASMGRSAPRVYVQVIQRQRIDFNLAWKLMRFADKPPSGPTSDPTVSPNRPDQREDIPVTQGISCESTYGRGGFRTCDLSRVKRALTTPPRPARPVFVAP
jgi:hypothetical protein